jgi:hypothetical protein
MTLSVTVSDWQNWCLFSGTSYTLKKLFDIPVPSRDVTIPNSSWAGIMT